MSKRKFYIDENDEMNETKSKRRKILEELEELDLLTEEPAQSNDSDDFLMSSYVPKKKPKEKEPEFTDSDSDSWLNAITNIDILADERISNRHHKKIEGGIFARQGKNKKKKKKKKTELIDYNKEFETEAALYRNLLQDQNRFTESLQKEYDRLKSTKSSARGISKTMTDLIENITQARGLSLQIVDKTVGLKKTTADLMMKQKKEFGSGTEENADMGSFASSYLKQMLNERQTIMNGTGNPEIVDYSDDMVDDLLDDGLGEYDADSETSKYLRYESQHVRVFAIINPSDYADAEFAAYDEDGNYISDYPLPTMTTLSINDSTLTATDTYGRKYPIKWK